MAERKEGLAGAAWLRRGCALGLAGLLLATLGACGAGDGPGGGSGGPAGGSLQTTQLVETDVEAPEVFQTTEQGLWDGRPSLGGVWVAHPDVRDPERVIIRNQDNGSFVIGALFRRERENPGPALQVSSDAAEALGMLAGSPAMLNVTALRREEAAVPAPTEATAPVAVPEEGGAGALAPEAVATTALDAAPLPAPGAAPNGDPAAAAAVAQATAALIGGPAQPAPAAPAGASSLDRPFIQLGIFSVEANAEALAREMTAKGLPARVAAASTQGQAFWRVLVGPAGTEAERAAFLDRVKAEGFADAYFVRN